MTAQELKDLFDITDGFLYRVKMNKTDMEMMQDTGQSIWTFSSMDGYFVFVLNEFAHEDYEKVE